jgi:hypothetical protein
MLIRISKIWVPSWYWCRHCSTLPCLVLSWLFLAQRFSCDLPDLPTLLDDFILLRGIPTRCTLHASHPHNHRKDEKDNDKGLVEFP